MCNGFGCIVSNAGNGAFNIHFIEPDGAGNCSHSDILRRMGWRDNQDQFDRKFVRVEFADWTEGSFRFDEWNSVPAWAEDLSAEIKEAAVRIMTRIKPAVDKYVGGYYTIRESYHVKERQIILSREKEIKPIAEKFASDKLHIRKRVSDKKYRLNKKLFAAHSTGDADAIQSARDALYEYKSAAYPQMRKDIEEVTNAYNDEESAVVAKYRVTLTELYEQYKAEYKASREEMLAALSSVPGYHAEPKDSEEQE